MIVKTVLSQSKFLIMKNYNEYSLSKIVEIASHTSLAHNCNIINIYK